MGRIEELESKVAALAAEVASLRDEEVAAPPGFDRRRALRFGALAAAAGTAAVVAGRSQPAAAGLLNNPFLLDEANAATASTSVASSNAAGAAFAFTRGSAANPDPMMTITNAGGGHGIDVTLTNVDNDDAGIHVVHNGDGPGIDVVRPAGATGAGLRVVHAGTGAPTAAQISSTAGLGLSAAGGTFGVAAAGNQIGLVAGGGLAALRLLPQATAGRPQDGQRGNVLVDNVGNLFVSTSDGVAGVAAWRRVMLAHPKYDNGLPNGNAGFAGSLNLLSVPFRLFDSRPGEPVPIANAGAKLQPGVTKGIQVTGTAPDPSATGAVAVPGGAVGLLCTITVVDTESAGFLKAFPTGITAPNTSVANWSSTGQILATTTIVRLSQGGTMTLVAGSNRTHAIVDCVGFLA